MNNTRRFWALMALGFSMLAVGVDATVLNLALPTLARDLHATTSDLQWFVDAFSLVLAVLLLPAGMLGDRFGRKKLLLLALVAFGIASLTCGFSTTPATLIAARALLGAGAAFIMPLSIAVLPVLFPDDHDRRKAMAVWTAFNALGFPIGPIIGGYLLGHFAWGAVFFINVPIVVVAVIAVAALLPESRGTRAAHIDVAGIATSSIALGALTYGVIEAGDKGIGDVGVLVPLAIAVVAAALFAVVEKRAGDDALVDLSLFSSPGFAWGSALATLVTFAMFGVLFTVPQLLQSVHGEDAMGAGLRMLPLIGGLFLGAGAGSRVAKALGDRAIITIGFVVLADGLALGGMTRVDDAPSSVLAWMALVGAGLGLSMPTAMSAALGELGVDRSGAGSALLMALRQVGGAVGVALLGTLLSSTYRGALDVGALPHALAVLAHKGVTAALAVAAKLHDDALAASAKAAFVVGMDQMLFACAAIALIGAVLAAAFLPRRGAHVAVHVAG